MYSDDNGIMKIHQISISNLRNHTFSELSIEKDLNVLYGLNGSGKTTILEALSICSFSKSFQPVSDSSLIRYGESFFNVETIALNDLEVNYKSKVRFETGSRKEINSTFGSNLLAKDIIGAMPLVVLSPDLKIITSGSPQDRREFIDRLLSQSSRVYFEKLMDYRKILKQRNNFLNQIKNERKFDKNLLDSFTEMLIDSGCEIILYRIKFINEFLPFFTESYSIVSSLREKVNLEYQPNSILGINTLTDYNKDELKEILSNKAKALLFEETRRGLTLFGPQKDELLIRIDSGIAREAASQGQHKTLLISLKFAEYYFLKEKRNETPIVLLDDIFSELDAERIEKVFELLKSDSAQTFITMTDVKLLNEIVSKSEFSFFLVNNGTVLRTN